MRATLRTVTGVGCVTAALLLAGPARGQMSGGTGTFSGGGSGGGSSGGSGSGGSGSRSQNVGSGGIDTQQLDQGITGGSLLNSFANVGTGSTSRGGSSVVSTSNPLSAYYYNPMAQGLVSGSGTGSSTGNAAAFGQPLFSNLSSSSSSLGGRNTGSAFGGSSTTGSSFGGVGSTTSRTGSSSGLTGTASIGGRGTTGTSGTIAPGFTGGAWGPAIGRRGPVVSATLRTPARPIAAAARRNDLQAIITRSTTLTSASGISVTTDGDAIVLTGTVVTEDDRRIAENMLRLAPGVNNLRNELRVTAPTAP